MGRIAELDRVETLKSFVAAFTDHFTNPAVCCYPEIVFRDRAFQFVQHLAVRLWRFGLIIGVHA